MSLAYAVGRLVERRDLTSDEAAAALEEIIKTDADPALIAGFLTALRTKGETADEIAGLAKKMREHAVPVRPQTPGLIDTCGTGGDGSGTLNISTAAAFVVAGAGVPVAKHGNRALSSRCGSADVLEALGLNLNLPANQVAECIDECGIGFMFAPAFHPAMAKLMGVRKALGIRTAFNLLGPLTNPANPEFQLVGAGTPKIAQLLAGVLAKMEVRRAFVVHSNGCDELTAGENLAYRVEDGQVSTEHLETPGTQTLELAGSDAQGNATRLKALLDGESGPYRECVAINAGAALMVAGKADRIDAGMEMAKESIDSGQAAKIMDALIERSSSG